MAFEKLKRLVAGVRVVRGYRSRLDGSVQPYGLVVPESVKNAGASFDDPPPAED